MFVAACCFGAGFLVSALGVKLHNLWIVYLGYGLIGGIGLGIGYISPVSTLIKWFPDRPGMATGMAIMGFGGGAMIGSPLAVMLMKSFATATSAGVAEAFVTMGIVYFLFMMIGVLLVRLPAEGWRPEGYVPRAASAGLITVGNVTVDQAFKTRQFWQLWLVLCMNVTAGIGILETASPMIQEMFPGHVSAVTAGGFVGLLSIFNMAGRFIWASTSDYMGRRNTYMVFFTLGIVLYATIPSIGHMGSVPLFVIVCAILLSMYGGGFATIPAYLKDVFGTMHVGAIHGRLLTAWSVAGVLGPVLVNYIREYQLGQGVAKSDVYDVTMYLMAVLLAVGFVSNWFMKPVDDRHHYQGTPLEA
jgi:MFS family permease